MNVVYKKTRKLLLNPKKFFEDSKYFNQRVKVNAAPNVKKIVLKKNEAKVSNNKSGINLYVCNSYNNVPKLKNHIEVSCGKYVNLKFGDYRLKPNEVIFDFSGNIYRYELSYPFENDTLVKGLLLITPNLIDKYEDVDQKLLNVIHQINVSHMKSLNDFNSLYYYYKDRPECTEESKVKYALNAGIYTQEIISLAINLIDSKYLTLHQNDLILIFRKLYRILGPDARLESIANKLAGTIRKELFPVHFIMLLAAFFTESGEYEKAIEMAGKAKSKDKDAWSKYRFLGLTHLLYSNKYLDDEWAKNDHDLFLQLSKDEWEFELYASLNKKSISIVGNAPIEIGLRKGAEIDKGYKVTRFNGAITDYPFSLDYGKKTNILVINPRYYETPRNRKFGLDFIIISDGNLYSTKNLALKIHDLKQYSDKICLLPRRLDLTLTQKIGASPSSGLKYLSWLYSINGPIPRENVYGFSLTDQAHGVATSYSSGRRVGLNTIHNWSSEKYHLESLVE